MNRLELFNYKYNTKKNKFLNEKKFTTSKLKNFRNDLSLFPLFYGLPDTQFTVVVSSNVYLATRNQ